MKDSRGIPPRELRVARQSTRSATSQTHTSAVSFAAICVKASCAPSCDHLASDLTRSGIAQQQLGAHVGQLAADQHVASIRGVAAGIISPVMLEKLARFAGFHETLVDIEVASVTLVAGIGDACAIRRPAAEEVDGLWLCGEGGKGRAGCAE